MLKKRKKHNVLVRKEAAKSRFLVDLNQDFLKKEEDFFETKKDSFIFKRPGRSFFIFDEKYLKGWLFYPLIHLCVVLGKGVVSFFTLNFIKKKKPETVFQLIPREKNTFLNFKTHNFEKKDPKKKEKKSFNFKFLLPRFRFESIKFSLVFSLILCVLALPIKSFSFYYNLQDTKGRVLGVSEEAFSNMFLAGEQVKTKDFNGAQKSFAKAQTFFLEAKDETRKLNIFLDLLAKVIPSDKVKLASLGNELTEAGAIASRIGEELSGAFDVFLNEEKDMKVFVEELSKNFIRIRNLSEDLNTILASIEEQALPKEYREKFISLRDNFYKIQPGVEEISDILIKIKIFLGFEYDKRYLLVFQNNTELRASGGFIGSYALLDFQNGKVKNIEVPEGGSYDTEGGMYEKFLAPQALQLVSPYWYFWDANWWPDWPMSAKKLEYFLEKSSGPSVDGVIAFTPTVLEGILEIFGPIELETEKYSLTLTADNFLQIIQTFAEEKPQDHPDYKQNPYLNNFVISKMASSTELDENLKPKKIIGVLFNTLLDEIPAKLSKQVFVSFVRKMEESLQEKHILLNFKDQFLQEKLEEYNFTGEVRTTDHDYLQIVHTNIAGGKSDKNMKDQAALKSEILKDGTVENTLIIKRTHTGIKEEQFFGQRNVDWIRVYVPKGAELVETTGFIAPEKDLFPDPPLDAQIDEDLLSGEGRAEVCPDTGTKTYEEFGKTVFANWLMVDPGESKIITIKYRLPKIIKKESDYDIYSHSLLWQKQPGTREMMFKYILNIDDNYQVIYEPAVNVDCEEKCEIKTDMFWGFLLEKLSF